MKCIIPGANIKVFGRAIHSLSKVGDELYFEPLESGLSLRTVNSSRSAYAYFVFSPLFFIHYDDGSELTSSGDSPADAIRCKIGVKPCLTVFKSLSTLEKSVDKCIVHLDFDESRLVFQLYCRHGIVKTHKLSFIESESLQAVYSIDQSANTLVAQTRLFSDVVINFQSNQEEVSLIVNAESATFKNYVEDEADPNKVIHTALALNPEEFESYQVIIDSDITFCLKEFRALLAFSEPSNLPLSLHFDTSGKPIIFSLSSDPSFEANFVLATLSEKPVSQITPSQQSSQIPSRHVKPQPSTSKANSSFCTSISAYTPHRVQKTTTAKANTSTSSGVSSKQPTHNSAEPQIRSDGKKGHSSQIKRTFQDLSEGVFDGNDPVEHKRESRSQPKNFPGQMVNVTGTCGSKEKSNNISTENHVLHSDMDEAENHVLCNAMDEEDGTDEPGSPEIPVQVNRKKKSMENQAPSDRRITSLVNLDSDSEDSEKSNDLVPGTPPSKRFRSLFFGLSQSTTAGTQSSQQQQQQNATVLVEDTDEED